MQSIREWCYRLTLGLSLAVLLIMAGTTRAEGEEPILRAGDTLFLSLPGEDAFNKTFEIDPNGRILLPEVGPVSVTGKPLSEATTLIKLAVSQAYRDIERFTVDLKERRLMLQVLGYVEQPGMVTIPSNGNVQTAIQAAGGLVQGAQLDKMILKHQGKSTEFSYKAYLDSGNSNLLPKLESLDELFIPASPLTGNVQINFDAATLKSSGDAADDQQAIRIFGEVANAGLFAYKEGGNIIDAIMRAGGVTRYAGVEQIKVINRDEPASFNLKAYLETGDPSKLPPLEPGATIFVPIQETGIRTGNRVIYVMGEVFKPGAFETQPGASLLDILANAGGPTRFAETRQMRILHPTGLVTPFDLQAYTEGVLGAVTLPKINPGDAIFVPEKAETQQNSWLKVPPNRSVKVMGQVYQPGRFEWSEEMSLLDLLAHAGGPTARADIADVRILSENSQGKIETVEFNLDTFLKRGGDVSLIPDIDAGDTVIIPELPQDPSDNKAQWVRQSKEQSIYIMGQVGAPGRYTFNSEMTFLDILSAADGPNGNADIHNIRIIHRSGNSAQMTPLNLARYFETGDETLLPKVVTGDTIFVPEKDKNWLDIRKEDTVRVLGAVSRPGRYAFTDNMTLLDLLAQAGGTANQAYLEHIVVVNTSCCTDQATSFDLIEFVKAPDLAQLPVVRAGDTVFVPSKEDSNWSIFMEGITDIFKVVSIVAIVGAL